MDRISDILFKVMGLCLICFGIYLIGVLVFWWLTNALEAALLWPILLFLAIYIKIIGW